MVARRWIAQFAQVRRAVGLTPELEQVVRMLLRLVVHTLFVVVE